MIATTQVISEVPPIIAVQSRAPALLYRAFVFPLKFVWGMLFCQSLLGSILLVGWTYRLAQRAALKFWWSRRAYSERGITLDQFLSASERTKPHQHWPNWFLQQNFRETIRSPERRAPALRDSPAEDVSEKSAPSPPPCRAEAARRRGEERAGLSSEVLLTKEGERRPFPADRVAGLRP